MIEEFQGGVCGDAWWNPNFFSGDGGGGGGPCSVARFDDHYDIGNLGWPHDIMKGKSNNEFYVDNSLVISADLDSTLDILGFSLSPTSTTIDWNQQNQFCKIGSNEENLNSIFEDNSSRTMMNSSNFLSQDGSSPTTMTTCSNTSVDSNTIACEAGLTTSFPMSTSTSYLIQTLFSDDESQLINTFNYDQEMTTSPSPDSSIDNSTHVFPSPPPPRFITHERCNNAEALSQINDSLLNSLQLRPRPPSSNKKSPKLKDLKDEKVLNKERTKNMKYEQPTAKRPRIETPSPLPTFKVRKEKLGDRITALQQLVSPFGKTDTASVLQEAIEYINFLHDQVHVLSTPYLKNGVVGQHHQQVSNKIDGDKDLRSRGLCVVPISSTYPVTQETSVDFWTPTFEGTPLRA